MAFYSKVHLKKLQEKTTTCLCHLDLSSTTGGMVYKYLKGNSWRVLKLDDGFLSAMSTTMEVI